MPPPPRKSSGPPARKVSKILLPPNFFNGRPICEKVNRPSYESKKALQDYYEKNFPRFGIKESWLCEFCNTWHAIGVPPAPSGETSGKKRSEKQGHA